MRPYTDLRANIRQQRRQLNPIYKTKASKAIASQLINHPVLKNSTKIAGYLSSDGEVDLRLWFKRVWQLSKQCYLPVVVQSELLFAHYTQHTALCPNQWGILEPVSSPYLPVSELDAIILPVVAFDSQCNRLGRGAGYYDRSLYFINRGSHHKKPYLIGVAYASQEIPCLMTNAWDIPMHTLITELEIMSPD